MYLDDRSFTTSTLTAAAGCEPMTFRTWRNRNGLFPEVAGGRKWKRFTIVDVCIVRAIVVMTSHGLPVTNAINFSQYNLRGPFDRILVGEVPSDIVGFFAGGARTDSDGFNRNENGTQKVYLTNDLPEANASFVFLDGSAGLADTVAKTKGIITIVDLKALAQQVLDTLVKVEI